MMLNKSKLTYILLAAGLTVCVGGMAFLGFSIFSDNSVKMTDFENSTKEDVLKWVTKNDLQDNIKYEYDYSETVENGSVISQSLAADEKITDDITITITISKGSIIKLDINDYKTKSEFEAFIAKYPKVKVTYSEDTISNTNSELTKFSKNSVDIKSDELTVYLSSSTNKDNKDDNKDKGNKVLIPNNLLGMEESKFIKKLNDLGFKNLKKNDNKYYSFTSKKDTVYSYDDGKFDIGRTINYALSLGDYPTSFKNTEYNNQTLDAANKLVKKYNDLNAHITLKTNNKETTDSKSVGKLANCTCTKNSNTSVITCDIYTSKTETINVPSYAGKTESELIEALKQLGITKYNKTGSNYSISVASGSVITNDTGSKKKTDTINYTLSLGAYQFNKDEYDGSTLSNATNLVNSYNNLGANIQLNTLNEIETEDQQLNSVLTGCEMTSGGRNIITCDIYKFIQRYSIIDKSIIKQQYSGSSYDDTVSKLKSYFSPFTNVKYIGVESHLSVGQIVDVRVDGNGQYDTTIKYLPNVLIEVEICQNESE